jgi:8-oxo-dGTP pyrophosphatase MutT (NUDIX family)
MNPTSCGVLALNGSGALLLCHLTGTRYWDVPKGLREEGEAARAAALREAEEECGLRFEPDALLDLGVFRYRPHKDLNLFAVLLERADTDGLQCRSRFRDRAGRLQPEVDAFAWVPFHRVTASCAPSLAAVLTRRLSLADLEARLLEHARSPEGP